MASSLPSDPYAALGVAKDATAAAIKTAHRKLVLKCHPDKVTNPTEKQTASDKFHKIQSAYEILIDQSRRERYDAQVRLAELRKEALARQSEGQTRGAERRTNSYRPEAPRTAHAERTVPKYEERRPTHHPADYFDPQPRSTPRREPEYAERPASKRPETKEKPRSSTRSSQESEKDRRKEKVRQAERDVRKERERKREPYVEELSANESDEYESRPRNVRDDDDVRRVRESYPEQLPRPQKDAHDTYYDDRARKLASYTADARDYIMSSRVGVRPRTEERRPSPVRMGSSKDRVQFVKRDDGRPAYMVRRPSEKPTKEPKDDRKREKEAFRKTPSRPLERRSSAEEVNGRKPPPLNTSKSSPANIHIPSEKQRATSLQPDSAAKPSPSAKRSETTPHNASSRRGENVPPKSSTRTSEFTNGESTPATTPDQQVPPSSKSSHVRPSFVDGVEYATPENYRTSHQQERSRPVYSRKITRSPSPLREYAQRPREAAHDAVPRARETMRDAYGRETTHRSRDNREESYRDSRDSRGQRPANHRTASARMPERAQPPSLNTRTTSYVYTPAGVEPLGPRPSPAREPSPRDHGLYHGDFSTTRSSPRHVDTGSNPRFSNSIRPENLKVQSGYGYAVRPNGERPQINRTHSSGMYRQQSVRA